MLADASGWTVALLTILSRDGSMAQVPEGCPKTRGRVTDQECPHPPVRGEDEPSAVRNLDGRSNHYILWLRNLEREPVSSEPITATTGIHTYDNKEIFDEHNR